MPELADDTKARIREAFAANPDLSIRGIGKLCGVTFDTAKKYAPPDRVNRKPTIMRLPIDRIHMDDALQMRVRMDEPTVKHYGELMADGEEFPPPTVVFDGSVYWAADGWHRIRAALAAGLTEIDVEVREGTREDAIVFAAGANAKHPLPLTREDRRRAVMTMCRLKPDWPARNIANHCGTSHALVNHVRKELAEGNGEIGKWPRREPAVDAPSKVETNGYHDPDVANDPPDVAEGRRNGTIPVDAKVEITEPDPLDAPSSEAEQPPPLMTDAEYLESLPARAQLNDPCRKRFDAEAIAFRRVTPHRLEFARKCVQITNQAKQEMRGHIGPWMSRHFRYLRLNDPARWQACKDCTGTGQVPLIGACPACKGEGYHA